MNELFLNEMSLEGQFDTIDEFLDACIPFFKCMNFINKENEGLNERKWELLKHSQLYERYITKEFKFNDIRGMKGDKIRKLKSVLLKTLDSPPFWDVDFSKFAQDSNKRYCFKEIDISMSSLSEAAERNGQVISFCNDKYIDCNILVSNGEKFFTVISSVNIKHLLKSLWNDKKIDVYTFLKLYFDESRLDFSKFEKKYGFDEFELSEVNECFEAFELMDELESWDDIYIHNALHYKAYSPSSKKTNWFADTQYEKKHIDKFRCGNPKRCFGYKEGEKFYVLRMERDHKVSDNG